MLAMAAVAMSPWLLPSSPHTSFNVAAVLLAPGSTNVFTDFPWLQRMSMASQMIYTHGLKIMVESGFE